MITINNLTMGFTQRTLFKDVTFSIFPNEKIGLTGPNGAGKTTLFSIIRGEREALAGEIQVQKGINIGYLPQEAKFKSERTVMQELTEGDDRIKALRREKRKLEDENKAASHRYGDVLEELEALGIYELEHRAEKILSGLGFKPEDFDRPIQHLSGGWQMRTLLAKLLTYPYDLLLLDEPTNYLDLDATLWLKDYLKSYSGSFVLISHDRVFLNEVTNYTIVLEGAGMTKIKGNYEFFEEQKGVNLKTLEKKQKVIEKKRKQLERFTQRFHAQPNRAAAVRNKRKQIERLENIELPQDQKSIGEFEFAEAPASGYVVEHLKGVSKSYGKKRVYADLDMEVLRGQKICLVGPNGAGKSTLLKMLAGVVEPDGGEIRLGHQVERGYFSQSRLDVLNPTRNAFEEVASAAPQGVQSVRVRSLLGLFNFQGDDVFKPVKVLSGGEKSRVILARLLIHPPNFMLLDEPTTHLDLDGVKALTRAFQKYTGTVVFISHDLYFIREIADHIVEVRDGTIKTFPGGLNYYLDKRGLAGLGGGAPSPQVTEDNRAADKPGKSSGKKGGGNQSSSKTKDEKPNLKELREQHKAAKKRVSQIKNQLKNLEQEQKDLETESYAKSRHLSKQFDKGDPEMLKEYGRRLKEIQTRQREIESDIKKLKDERDRITR